MIIEHTDTSGLLLDVRSSNAFAIAVAMTETPASSGLYLATIASYGIWYVFLRSPTPVDYTTNRGYANVSEITIVSELVKYTTEVTTNALIFYNGGTYTLNIVSWLGLNYTGITGVFKLESYLKVDLLSAVATGTTTGFTVPIIPYTLQTECGYWSIRDPNDTILLEGIAIFKYGAT